VYLDDDLVDLMGAVESRDTMAGKEPHLILSLPTIDVFYSIIYIARQIFQREIEFKLYKQVISPYEFGYYYSP